MTTDVNEPTVAWMIVTTVVLSKYVWLRVLYIHRLVDALFYGSSHCVSIYVYMYSAMSRLDTCVLYKKNGIFIISFICTDGSFDIRA